MNYLNRFKDHINESLGIPESTLFYVDITKSGVFQEIIDFMDSYPLLNKKEEKEISIPYTNIRRFVTNWDLYKDFPVSQIIVNLCMIKKQPEDIQTIDLDTNRKSQNPFKIGGSAFPFAKGNERASTRIKDPIKLNVDHSLSIYIEIDFEYSSNFRKDRHDKKLEIKLESVISHELNHIYEFYKRKIKNEPEVEFATTVATMMDNKMRRPKKIWEFWQNNFTEYIYMAEPHEIRAYIQESKSYIDRRNFETFKKTRIWKTAKRMQNFSYIEFINKFNNIISEHNPEYVDKMIEALVKDFVQEYKKLSAEFKEKNIINPKKLEKMSYIEFLQFWENKIKEAGTILIKKMIRLYSYKKSKEENILL